MARPRSQPLIMARPRSQPLLDIKPYVPEFDNYARIRTGWLKHARKTVDDRKSDDRFR